ncbi:type VI secretion system baseplate subunit TssE [Chitinivorax sp. PXF-14]|uniref:type VI secretion system baseplate subunit TssE n=1 Tax=Chitinivorax sp. PXF-14 TaxID=3230488 RepID=UPI003466469D
MVDRLPQDRLQPALLDRLTDDEPARRQEGPFVLNKARLRQAVLRDLTWLFNATQNAGPDDWPGYSEALRSVVNFGLPALAGSTASSLDVVDLERSIREAILDFEPRILPSSLSIEAVLSDQQMDHHNQLSVQIRGLLWAQPVPLELLLHTDLDLETGEVKITDVGNP